MTENPTGHDAIDSLSNETRTFAPPAAFAAAARISDGSLAAEAAADHEAFWARQARELLHWQQPFDTVLDWDLPNARWFEGGRLNVAENCLDRHVRDGLGERVAIHWEGEPGDTRTITYAELLEEVGRFANVLRSLGVGRGDRVALYARNHPESFVTLLAVSRIGALMVPLNWRLSEAELAWQMEDSAPALILHGPEFAVMATGLAAATGCRCQEIGDSLDAARAGHVMAAGEASGDAAAELLVVYTSGTTGRPKGAVLAQPAMIANAVMSHHAYAMTADDVVLNLLPLFHVGGLNIQPLPALLAGAGVIGLAVGFGAQTLVKDVITGVFILAEDQFRVGDVVRVNDKSGLVEEITIRTIRLRDLGGNVHMIPFSSVEMVENMTKDFSRYVFDVGIAYREDVDEVIDVLRDLGAEMQADDYYGPLINQPIEIMGLDQFADSAVIIRARLTTKPIKQWEVGREFNRRMKRMFDELGIEIPFPHQTIYFGEDKSGDAPSGYIELREGRDRKPAEAPARIDRPARTDSIDNVADDGE